VSIAMSLDRSNLGLSGYLSENEAVNQPSVEGTAIDFHDDLC